MAHLSEMAVKWFLSRKLIEQKDEVVFLYCTEIFFSYILSVGIIAFFCIITGRPLPNLVFFAVFCIFRHSVGGYHASTHFRCAAVLIAVLTLYNMMLYSVEKILSLWWPLLFILSVIVILLVAPVESSQKPLSHDMKTRLRNKARIQLAILTVVNLLIYFLGGINLLGFINLALGFVAVSAGVGKVANGIT